MSCSPLPFVLSFFIVIATILCLELLGLGGRRARVRSEILNLLKLHGALRGLDLVKLSELRGGKLRRGSVYVYLHEMECDGLVSSSPLAIEPGLDFPRRVYWLRNEGEFGPRKLGAEDQTGPRNDE